ncbi:DNA replication and repair protein RecF [Spirochaetia bacterium]|nr:DNA replication and repair protein RecF [Spirochaetia bacterium]
MIVSLRTFCFRNLVDCETVIDSNNIFLVGKNGQGKSNFLEAIYFSSYASSFRTSKDSDIICKDKNSLSVQAKNNSILDNDIIVKLENKKKQILIDGKKTESRKSLLSLISCIVFCHEDMEFVTGAPEKRRWFFDQNICLYDPLYLDDLIRYKKILKSRNLLLKEIREGRNKEVLSVFNPQLAEYGARLMVKREQEIKHFSSVFVQAYELISGVTGIEVKYKKSWNNNDQNEIVKYLELNVERDLTIGTTMSGPHRDRYYFIKDGKDFTEIASTGQKRLLALLLRIAQTTRYTAVTKNKPIVLFDDVLLELDKEKRKIFLSKLPQYEQAFYTFLPDEPFDEYMQDNTKIFYVNEGRLNDNKSW